MSTAATATMASMITRSSLEIMLEAIRQRDERPKDIPPALPVRPTSRGRLPTSRRSLPVGVTLENSANISLKEAVKCKEVKEGKLAVDGNEATLESGIHSNKIEDLQSSSNQHHQCILKIQKSYRCLQARRSYSKLKTGAAALQSFIRGERARCEFEVLSKKWRAAVVIQKLVRSWIARTMLNDLKKDYILLQSVIRGWLARKHFTNLRNQRLSKVDTSKINGGLHRNHLLYLKESDIEHPPSDPSVVAGLQQRILKVETLLREKEEENAVLRQQLQQYETRWSEYEKRMKSMEHSWQKQLTSLQMSLAAAKKSLTPSDLKSPPGRADVSPINHYLDQEDALAVGTRVPEDTRIKQPANNMRNDDNTNTSNAVIHLVNDFELHKQVFEDDIGYHVEVKAGQLSSNGSHYEEFRKLKARFTAWKRDYKARLRDTKTALHKHCNLEMKTHKKWWGKWNPK